MTALSEGSWLLRLTPDDSSVTARSALPESWISQISSSIGVGPTGWAVELGQQMSSRMVADIPELGADGIIRELRRGCEASAYMSLARALGEPAPTVDELPGLLAGPEELVSRGLGVHHMLRSIHIAHAVAAHAFLSAAERHLPAEKQFSEACRLMDIVFSVVDQLDERVSREFEAVQAAWLASSTAVRSQLVNEILNCEQVSLDHAKRTLGYDLTWHHVGVVAWADDQADLSSSQLRDLVRELLTGAGLTTALTLPVGQRRVWAWGGSSLVPGDLQFLSADQHPGLGIAVGELSSGLAGFRETHRQAIETARVAMASTESQRHLYRFHEVDLVTMISKDPAVASEFVERELGQLAAHDEVAAVLRITLKRYLESDRSLQKTADQMHLARSTVAHRISRAERLRGRAVGERRMQLEAALALLVEFPSLLGSRQPNETSLQQR